MEKFHEKYFGAQDQSFLDDPTIFDFPLKKNDFTKKENTHVLTTWNCGSRSGGDNGYLLVDFDQDNYHFINNLYLKIYNPYKSPLRDIIKDINLEIGGTSFGNIHEDVEIMLSNYSYLNLVKPTVQVDNFLYVYLPFINKHSVLFCKGGHQDVKLKITFLGYSDKRKFRLYADSYTLNDDYKLTDIYSHGERPFEKIYAFELETIILNSQIDTFQNTVYKNTPCNFVSPVHCIFLNIVEKNQDISPGSKSEFVKSNSNLLNVQLFLEGDLVFDGLPEKISASEYIINFSNEFFTPHTSTINFSMINYKNRSGSFIKVTTDSDNENEYTIIHAITCNTIRSINGMHGLRFSK
jgi:hypothetical protein